MYRSLGRAGLVAVLVAPVSACAPPADHKDHDVLKAVIADMLASRSSLPVGIGRDIASLTPKVLVGRRTPGFSGWITRDQINCDTSFNTKADDMVASLASRNQETYRWRGDRLNAPEAVVIGIPQEVDEDWVARAEPNAQYYIVAWRPGYTPTGDRAFVRFWLGPCLNSAVGSVLLERRGDGWAVIERHYAIFPD